MSTATISASEATDVLCAHCALPVPEGLLDDDAERQFCCSGCHTAFGILHAHGLDSYYGFAERREAPVRASGRRYDEFDHPAFAKLYVTALPNGLSLRRDFPLSSRSTISTLESKVLGMMSQ